MIGILEISGRRYDGERFVVYRTVNLYDGIVADFVREYESAGCTDIRIRIV